MDLRFHPPFLKLRIDYDKDSSEQVRAAVGELRRIGENTGQRVDDSGISVGLFVLRLLPDDDAEARMAAIRTAHSSIDDAPPLQPQRPEETVDIDPYYL